MIRAAVIALTLSLIAVSAWACQGCGCKGGPGFRGPNGRCVGWSDLDRVCGSPPETRCSHEGLPKIEEPAAQACGDRGGPGYRARDGHCVAAKVLDRLCGTPPETRCVNETK